MNEILRNVLTRKSVHQFSTAQIADSELGEIVSAGRFVASVTQNKQWHFSIVQNRSVLEALNTQCGRFYIDRGNEWIMHLQESNALKFLCNAPTFAVISSAENSEEEQDAANTIFGNMMLVGEKISVSSCWTHWIKSFFDENRDAEILRRLGVPDGFTPLCTGVFGYRAILGRNKVKTDEPVIVQDGIIQIIK